MAISGRRSRKHANSGWRDCAQWAGGALAGKEAGNDAANAGHAGVSLLTKAASLPMDIRRMCRLIREQARSHTFFPCRKVGDVWMFDKRGRPSRRHAAELRVHMQASSRLKPVPRKLRVQSARWGGERGCRTALAGKSPGNDAADTAHAG